MHTVPSRDHIDPHEFRRISREQIETRYDSIWFEKTTITHAAKKTIGGDGDGDGDGAYQGFQVKDDQGRTYEGRKLILATGSRDVFPAIPGYAENWPGHIYQCLACDGFEQRGTPIGILEFNNPMAAHMVGMAMSFDSRVTVFSNGPISTEAPIQQALKLSKALGAKIDDRNITRLVNNGPSHTDGVTVEFETGDPVTLGFLVHRPPTVNRADHLVEQLALETVDPAMGRTRQGKRHVQRNEPVRRLRCRRYHGRDETGRNRNRRGTESRGRCWHANRDREGRGSSGGI
ncbi:hypothetical protein K504DRAFT_461394 [Pleomassaria siparia CBS 279.74]|uniref:Uncharacterized protein n=1 Tax=Pleomassaria siparia CBS 279.74 TaxID=1314801 RepID=A0A6G1JWP7_9PLEO|nr:hypothetical protein K504DRAFT_461394 [Pleomassaria siparia CBS 279.74]